MEYSPDFRFRPTDQDIIDYYLRLKHIGIEEGDVNHFINNVEISSFDPWDLPSKSKSKWNDKMVWYFYSRDEYKFGEGVWITNTGYWKEIKPNNTPIIGNCKGTNGVKIGEKKVLVFHSYEDHSKSDWVMHVYQPTFLPPDQRTYVVCKVEFKSEDKEPIPSGNVLGLDQFGASSTTRSEVHQGNSSSLSECKSGIRDS